MQVEDAFLSARGVYCGKLVTPATHERGVARRAYIAERSHLAVGLADMLFSEFQKFISLTIESIAK